LHRLTLSSERWTVCPEGSDDRYEGEFPFAVGHVAASVAEPAL
jgi:hypothetical protein